ncbi:MAG: DUF4124 domain-containing protein [Gammaproteobacteria bacterium SHHR-1]|uniref:DUF4124 domain-containing protein n=1 Tax=Magnetovirga frankeli TaxID=947516 RepID=UPI001293CCC3|nr:DUF4124 domain-containing protein [gamma proteobacterium SS-5]
MKRLMIALALCVSANVSAAVYKCEDKYGRVTFSQVPCAVDAEKIEVREVSAIKSDLDVQAINQRAQERVEAAEQARAARARAALEERRHQDNIKAQKEIAEAQREQARALRAIPRW